MSAVLAFDPGADTGFAYYEGGELVTAGCLPWGEVTPATVLGPCLGGLLKLVIELPQVYALSKARASNIVTLAFRAGTLAGRFEDFSCGGVFLPSPADWKGQVPKEIMCARIEAAFSLQERSIVAQYKGPQSKRHNMIDAIGLAKWAQR